MAHEQNNLHGPQGTEVDPVCGMDVDITSAAASHQHGGRSYYFCRIATLQRLSLIVA